MSSHVSLRAVVVSVPVDPAAAVLTALLLLVGMNPMPVTLSDAGCSGIVNNRGDTAERGESTADTRLAGTAGGGMIGFAELRFRTVTAGAACG